ncbi:MAG: MATE family efflux transporter [Bacillota bacterium]|nr:MATE family efflux transporter [Bacillota bacterium]
MKDLTTGNEFKVIFTFSVPILIGNVFQQLYNTIDSIIVGKFLGKEALAAVGSSFNIMLLLVALASGLTLGTNILVSRYFGAKDFASVKKAIDTSYVFTLILSILVTILGICISKSILLLFSVPNEILPLAQTFLNIILLGTISSFFYNTISGILRSLGNSKTPLYFLILSTLLNIVLDIIFILLLNLGIGGTAFATVLSQTFAFICSLIYLNKTYPQLKFDIRNINFDLAIFKQNLKIGLPSGVQQALVTCGFLILQFLVNRFGPDAMAAYAAAGKVDSFAEMPVLNLGIAISTFISQNMGANKYDRIKKGYISTLGIGFIISILASTIVISFPKQFMNLFTNDSSVTQIGISYLSTIGLFYILYSTMVITNGVIIGLGNSLIPMLATTTTLWGIQIPLSIFLSRKMGIDGIWLAVPFGWLAGVIFRVTYFLSGRWKKKFSTAQANLNLNN